MLASPLRLDSVAVWFEKAVISTAVWQAAITQTHFFHNVISIISHTTILYLPLAILITALPEYDI